MNVMVVLAARKSFAPEKKEKKMFIFTSRTRRPNKISNGRENKSLWIRSVYFVGLRKHADTSVERIENESLNYRTLAGINALQWYVALKSQLDYH